MISSEFRKAHNVGLPGDVLLFTLMLCVPEGASGETSYRLGILLLKPRRN